MAGQVSLRDLSREIKPPETRFRLSPKCPLIRCSTDSRPGSVYEPSFLRNVVGLPDLTPFSMLRSLDTCFGELVLDINYCQDLFRIFLHAYFYWFAFAFQFCLSTSVRDLLKRFCKVATCLLMAASLSSYHSFDVPLTVVSVEFV